MHRGITAWLAIAATAIVAAALVGTASAADTGGKAATVTTPVKVNVVMSDFKFRLSTKTVPKGKPIVFNITNRGPSPHDFDIKGSKGSPVILAGRKTTLRTAFSKAGSFLYVCTVPRHAQFGMTGRLTVK